MAEIAISAAFQAVGLGFSLLPLINSSTRPDLDSIRSKLQTMQAYLRYTEEDGGGGEDEWSRNRVLQIRDLAYEIEDIVDKFLLDVPQHFHQHIVTRVLHHVAHPFDVIAHHRFSSAVRDVDAKIRNIRFLDDIRDRRLSDPAPHVTSGWDTGPSTPEAYLVPKEDELVGIDGRASVLSRAILEGESHLVVVAMFGPRGSGKTTVLKEVFKRFKKERMFERCIWINVLSASSSEALLKTVVAAVGGPTPMHLEMEAENRLAHLLQKKRYALFFDGISSKVNFSHVMSLLPDDFNGSRVIISTHEQDVASNYARPPNKVHQVESLRWKESWRLLCKIAFPGGECPEHLVEWTENLLKKCEGSPVAVVAMGRLLLTKHQSPGELRKLHDSLGHELGGNAGLSFLGRILLPSYHSLSHNKKCCFLYFSNIPEDNSITRGRLIRLWMAERFVEEVRGMTLEEVAGEYLNELIKMGLVIVSRRDSEGNARSCRVENLVLEFILSKSEKEAFCSVLQGSSAASADKNIRRVSLQGFGSSSFLRGADLSRVRSLMMFTSELLPRKPLENFSLLRVLDFEDSNLQHFPEEIVKLRLLGYLSLRNTDVKEIPKFIKKLKSLVTLDLRQTRITNLPNGISKLQQLVYLLVTRKYSSLEGVEVVRDIRQLASLQKLSLVKANRKNCFAEELKSMTELRKLGISGLTKEDGKALCESLVGMTRLYSLQVISASQQEEELVELDIPIPRFIRSLYLAAHLPRWISSLDSLAKLHLQWSRLRSSQLEALQGLPCLVKLKLADDAYVDDKLVVSDGWFGKLKVLELERLNMLEIVEVKPGAMPQLTKLDIKGCGRMTVPPLGVDNLTNLE